jgi:hypothetical protein
MRLDDMQTQAKPLPLASHTAKIERGMRANALRHLVAEVTWLNAGQIGAGSGCSQRGPSRTASRWQREGRIFAITLKGRTLYAAYQFDGNLQPRPVIGEVLAIFRHRHDPWKIAAWFAGANGWLRGARPQDCLDEPARVINAAQQEVNGWTG